MASFLFFSVISFFSCQSQKTGVKPELTKKYTETQVSEMMESYFVSMPEEVIPLYILQDNFAKAFPNAYDMEWKMGNNIYEVNFGIRYVNYKAYFDQEGELLMYSVHVRASGLPAMIKNACITKYPKYRIGNVNRIFVGDEVQYLLNLELQDAEVKILYQSDGTFIKELGVRNT